MTRTGGWPVRVLGPWWGVLLVLLGVGIGTAAGLWQLDRASEKRDLHARFSVGGSSEPLGQLVPDTTSGQFRYRRLRLTGQYDSEHQILLDNMSHEGQPGYQVLTPFSTPAGTVLVNRGWMRADGDRRIVPDLRVGRDTREITGRIEQLPRPGIELAVVAPPADATWPRRLHFPTSQQISAQLGVPLRSYQLLLDASEPDGYVRDWHPGGMGPERHVAYAVQWFGLALTAAVIYLVLLFRNRKKTP